MPPVFNQPLPEDIGRAKLPARLLRCRCIRRRLLIPRNRPASELLEVPRQFVGLAESAI